MARDEGLPTYEASEMVGGYRWLGVDVGWVFPAVDSEGRVYRWADKRTTRSIAQTTTSCGPVTITKADGSSQTVDPYDAPQMADIINRRNFGQRCQAIASRIVGYAIADGMGVALENWDDASRFTNWTALYDAIIRDGTRRSVPVALVPRQYTSQTCPQCGHVSKENRPTRDEFLCVACGMDGHADHIAAINVAAKVGGEGTEYRFGKRKLSATERQRLAS
jgi:predicted RNA-binding Zn-ribbon protein involved in translation (DUF1610 family)